MRLKNRIERLESRQQGALLPPFRIVATTPGETDLTRATCQRTRCENGQLMEIVNLNGSAEGISDEDIERFVATFLIKDLNQ